MPPAPVPLPKDVPRFTGFEKERLGEILDEIQKA
jgi:hypothetical protein